MTLQALPEIRAVQVGIAELQSRQPHGTDSTSGHRGHVLAGGEGGNSRRPRPGLRTRDRGKPAKTLEDQAKEMGPERRAASTGLPPRADASGLSRLLLRRGVCRLWRWAGARVRSGRCHQGASSLRTPGRWRLRAAAGAGKLSHGTQTLPAPPLSYSLDSRWCFEPLGPGQGSPPPRRTQAQRACKLGLAWETLLLPSHSHRKPPRPFSQSPSHRHPDARARLLGCARLRRSSAPAFARGVNSVSTPAPGSD